MTTMSKPQSALLILFDDKGEVDRAITFDDHTVAIDVGNTWHKRGKKFGYVLEVAKKWDAESPPEWYTEIKNLPVQKTML